MHFHYAVKGVVHQFCYDVKPFNLMACFITKCDTSVAHQNGAWHTMSVLIGKKSFICGRTVKLYGHGETFA